MRVIGGTARGHKLRVVPGTVTRPITDRAKEALFNIIAPDLPGASLLDLFAGTGSVGIEALSRGASFVRFTDKHPQAIQTVRANLASTKLAERAEVQRLDAFTLLEKTPDRTFEYIFIAPPQYKELWKRAMLSLQANPSWLSEDGWIVVQIDPLEYEDLALDEFEEIEQRKYGNTLFVFYEKPLTELE